MSKHPTQTAFRLPLDITEAMRMVKERDGVPQAEQVRRALRDWLEKRGALSPVTLRPDSDGGSADRPKRTDDYTATLMARAKRSAKKGARR